ncbi:MAG: glycosyltransferase [Clostridiaceae bacterium]
MSNPMISIIVPVYKAETYLYRCIDSILSQTFTSFELILIDDGSPDLCGTICDEYARKDSRVKVIHKENGGVSKARNTGIEAAIGKYIGFVDSDDYVEPTMYEKLYNSIMTYNTDLAMCSYTSVINGNKIDVFHNLCNNEYLDREYIENVVFTNIILCNTPGYFSLWNKLFKSEIIKKNNIRLDIEMFFGEDLLFVLDYLLNIKSMSCEALPLYNYITSETGLFSKYRREFIYDIMKCRRTLIVKLTKFNEIDKSFISVNIKYYAYICRYLKEVLNKENKSYQKKIILNSLKNHDVIKTISVISSIKRINLIKYQWSRRNLILPYLIKYKLYWSAYKFIKIKYEWL